MMPPLEPSSYSSSTSTQPSSVNFGSLPPLRPEDLAIDTSIATSSTNLSSVPVGSYGNLPPLRPEDLSPIRAPPKAVILPAEQPFSVGIVYDELKEKVKSTIMETPMSKILYAMRISNIVMGILMIIISIMTMILERSFWAGVSDVFSAFYTLMFASLLISYESRNAKFDHYLRENFGFMYNSYGRCAFLCFISIFPLSMGIYGVLVSVLGICNAYFNYFVITKHPSFSEGIPEYERTAVGSPDFA